ncbi:MAG: DUF4340 domain-containing protein [Chromatiaceae bacterium]|nr:DUF4340 domain-containing protein [Chromatiaceae bacterium]
MALTTSVMARARAALADWKPDLRTPLVLGLSALLVAQLLLGLALGWGPSSRSLAPGLSDAPLLDFAPEAVKRLRLQGPQGEAGVVLARSAGEHEWVLANLDDFPAQGLKVEQLLGDLSALRRTLPVATSAAARKRFKVADDAFAGRLVLESDQGVLASLMVGDSAGVRRLFARPAEDSAIYEIALGISDLSPRREDWIDRNALRLAAEDIVRVASADWTLNRMADGWTLAGADGTVDQDAAENLAQRLAALGYRTVLTPKEAAEMQAEAPRLELRLGLADGSERLYRFRTLPETDEALLESNSHSQSFRLAAYDLDGLIGLSLDALLTTESRELGQDDEDAPALPKPDEQGEKESGG